MTAPHDDVADVQALVGELEAPARLSGDVTVERDDLVVAAAEELADWHLVYRISAWRTSGLDPMRAMFMFDPKHRWWTRNDWSTDGPPIRPDEPGVAPCLGGNVFGWTASPEESFLVLDAFSAVGGNFIDTVDSYSAWIDGNTGGESETIIGNWMASRPVPR